MVRHSEAERATSELRRPSVSVVVPTRNRPDHLRRLLSSLDALSGCLPREVIVVDDSSRPETRETLGAWFRESHRFAARVIRQQSPVGPGRARNVGTRSAQGEIVAFTDDDCQVHPRWLEHLTLCVDSDPTIAGAGGRVLPVRQDIVSRYYTFHRILEPPPSLQYLVTANCCYLRRPFLEGGGFDEEIRKPGGEDVAASINLAKAGWRFAFAKDAVVFHEYRKGPFDLMMTFRNYGEGCRAVTEKVKARSHPRTELRYALYYGGLYADFPSRLLSPGNLVLDLWRELGRCSSRGLSSGTVVGFLFLRVLQNVGYSVGWRRGRS